MFQMGTRNSKASFIGCSLPADRNRTELGDRYFEVDKVAAAVQVFWRYKNQPDGPWRDVTIAYDDDGEPLTRSQRLAGLNLSEESLASYQPPPGGVCPDGCAA
jgi:hypothetical protein